MIAKYQKGIIGEIPPAEHDIGPFRNAIENCRFDKALDEIWEQIRGLNQYIDEEKPWELAKVNDEDHLREVLAYLVGALLEISDLLVPFMPETADKIQQIFSTGNLKQPATSLFPKHETKAPSAK